MIGPTVHHVLMNYQAKRMKIKAERERLHRLHLERVHRLRARGLTFAEIGFEIGKTRQRAQQLVQEAEVVLGVKA